jgi:hypothetical protein
MSMLVIHRPEPPQRFRERNACCPSAITMIEVGSARELGPGKGELLSLGGAKKSRKSIAGKICAPRQSGWSIGAEPWLKEA